MTTVLLTGMPRSGTTLLCALLNEMPNTIALAEPTAKFLKSEADQFIDLLERFIVATRRKALQHGVVRSKSIAGQVTDNFMAAPSATDGLRPSLARIADVKVDKPLTADFRLYIKHPAPFTALTQQLLRRFPLYALVRNPLAVLASWQTVDIPVNRGRLPAAERLDASLRAELDALPDQLDRQIAILAWYLRAYSALPADCLVRYEDLMRDPTTALSRIHGPVKELNIPLKPEAPEARYGNVDLGALAHALRPIAPLATPFYPDFQEDLARYSRT
jgi:hypothetical protein